MIMRGLHGARVHINVKDHFASALALEVFCNQNYSNSGILFGILTASIQLNSNV